MPQSKNVINGLAMIIRQHIEWNDWPKWSVAIEHFFWANFTYDFIYPFGKEHGVRTWFKGEHLHYNEAFPMFKSTNFLFLGQGDGLASVQSYHTVHWKGTWAGVPAPRHKPLIKIKDLDFWVLTGGKVSYNWCMVDMIAILRQGGYEVLPAWPLPGGIDYLPPRAMDGIPSPDSMFAKPSDAKKAHTTFHNMIREDFLEKKTDARWWTDDMMWCGPGGIGEAKSRGDYVNGFLKPLHAAFSGFSLQLDSHNCEGNYCGAHFHLIGTHVGTWLGQKATGRRISLRFGIHARVLVDAHVEGCGECGQIADSWAQIDIVAAFNQMGVDLLQRAKDHHAEASLAVEQLAISPADIIEPQQASARVDNNITVACFGCLAAMMMLVGTRVWRRVVSPIEILSPLLEDA